MPLYDYVCPNCGYEIEVMHSVHSNGPTACPVCGAAMKKAIVAPAVHFKGSGWARKERSGGSAKPARQSSEPEPGSSSGSDVEPSSGTGGQPKAAPAETTAKDAD